MRRCRALTTGATHAISWPAGPTRWSPTGPSARQATASHRTRQKSSTERSWLPSPEGDHEMFADRITQIKEKGIAEGRRLLWIFLYLRLLLGLFSIHKSVVLNEQNLIYHQGFAFINAAMLAKVMIAAEMFHVAEHLDHKPLIF